QVAEPRQVPAVPGGGHAEGLAHGGAGGLARRLPLQQHAEGVTGRQMQDDEDDEADAQEQQRGERQLPDHHHADAPERRELRRYFRSEERRVGKEWSPARLL